MGNCLHFYHMTAGTVKIFDYLSDLDCFLVSAQYRAVADELGLVEWSPVVWIGRLLLLDNDYGEHWLDNWDLREQLQPQAEAHGIPYEDLLMIDPERFKNDQDGPCHTPELRKRFWTDVLKSLELSYDVLFDEARSFNEHNRLYFPAEYIHDLDERMHRILAENTE